ncbi:hypothetical protein G5C51_18405 [Streptomyces sp. A7024]|uniref:Integral membrane protein n=1 Tax=Streptomyces coryli TaxID=1128680 RepID=A0A6G4U0R6_9ACTN|nr:hypothetical protein [Streptomyces coryli]NGN65859.1 hypothetical protein [Streptomyces coryli]
MDSNPVAIRALRAAVFTAMCVTLSAGAHVLLSTSPLPLTMVAALAGVVFVIAFALAGRRERGFWPIAALIVPLELAADTIFTVGQHACYGKAGGPVAGPLRVMGVDLLCRGGDFGTPLARYAGRTDGSALAASPWLLLAAHVAVGLIAAAWLRRGEAALGQLLRAVAAAAFRPLLLAAAVVAAALTPRKHSVGRAFGPRPIRTVVRLAHSVVRRGPPCPTAA